MNLKPTILFISVAPPTCYKLGTSYSLFQRLNLLSKFYDLIVISKSDARGCSMENVSLLNSFCRQVYLIPKSGNFIKNLWANFYTMPRMIKKSLSDNPGIQLIQLEFTECLFWAWQIKIWAFFRKRKISILLTEVDIHYVSRYTRYRYQGGFKNQIGYYLAKTWELFGLRHAVDWILVWGQDDLGELLRNGISRKKILVIPMLFNLAIKRTWRYPVWHKKSLVFQGDLKRRANLDSLGMIVREILPETKKGIVFPKLLAIGPKPKNVFSDRIVFPGYFKTLDPLLDEVVLAVQPLAWGAGIKIKIIEMFAYGIPTLVNDESVRNFDNLDKTKILWAKDSAGLKNLLLNVIDSPERLAQVSAYQRQYYQTNFRSDKIIDAYRSLYTELLSK